MNNLIERALQTFWQTLMAAGITIPSLSDTAAWKELLGVVVAALVAAALSAVKTWLRERAS